MSHNTSQRAQDLAVTITLDEHERRSRAVARLRWRDRTLIGSGPIAYRRQWVTVGGAFTAEATPRRSASPCGVVFVAAQFFARPHSVNACRDVEYRVHGQREDLRFDWEPARLAPP